MSVAAYYDGFLEQLVRDHRVGNKRVLAAIEFAKIALAGANRILDVGCGIGWTSAALAETGAEVTGLDISPRLIAKAEELFGEHCRFVCADFVRWESEAYDAVLMVDSYEHFPRVERPLVHEHLRQTGAMWVALTVPTVKTMQRARDEGIPLQIVDEDVTEKDIETLARDLRGKVVINRTVHISRPDDYRHVLITR